MDFRLFAHSWLSDWNHGNAHFLRGLARALRRHGHRVTLYEDVEAGDGGWSLRQLLREAEGAAAVAQMQAVYPELDIRLYSLRGGSARHLAARFRLRVAEAWTTELRGADVVMVHEWSEPKLSETLLAERSRHHFRLLFHDTHHRVVSQASCGVAQQVHNFDGVLAFGESLRQRYEREGKARRTFTLHEAADVSEFHPAKGWQTGAGAERRQDLVWIGNWGDEERTRELEEFVLQPAAQLEPGRARVYGVRYPPAALEQLARYGVQYLGYLPNLAAPAVYADAMATVHVPRAPYRTALLGIPTIRVFEALACGAVLLCAPWADTEGLFDPGSDYLVARNGAEMTALLAQLRRDPRQRKELGAHGQATILARHTCDHRAQELEAICRELA